MARIFRSRTRGSPYSGGSVVWLDINGAVVYQDSPVRNYNCECMDFIGSPVVAGNFTSRQYKGTYPCVTGSFRPTFGSAKEVRFNDFTVQGLPFDFVEPILLRVPNGWMLDLVAGTNPSRPVLNIPEAVENIVSLPKMVKNLGDLIMRPGSKMKPKGLAGEYLGVQFGWLPLIDDLTKLVNLQSYVLKRNRELHQLYSGKGLRRRLKFADNTTNAAYAGYHAVGLSLFTHNCSLTVKTRQWATITWYPTSLPPYHPDDDRWNDLSRRIVLGATPEAMMNGLWKVFPWTWLLGWFTNLGKYTLANSWTVPAIPGTGCFMNEASATYMSAGFSCTDATAVKINHKGVATRSVKTRVTSSTVVAGANMPYLDMFRLSILGSLFAQKFLK